MLGSMIEHNTCITAKKLGDLMCDSISTMLDQSNVNEAANLV